MTFVYVYGFAALAVAAVFALTRVERGPSMFDRVVALDVVTAVVLGTVTLISALTGRDDLVPVLIVLAIVGFVGSVSVARFAAAESAEEARILTRDELAVVLAQQESISDEDAPVHDPDASPLEDPEDTPVLGPEGSADLAADGATDLTADGATDVGADDEDVADDGGAPGEVARSGSDRGSRATTAPGEGHEVRPRHEQGEDR